MLKLFKITARVGRFCILLYAVLAISFASASSLEARQCADSLGQISTNEESVLGLELKVLSWNIQKASNEGWDIDLSELGEHIQLAFIQEASLQAPIAQTLPMPLYQAFAAGYTTDSSETGVMTLSTGYPSLACNLTAWEPWLGTPKATNITEYPLAGRDDRLLTINMHAVNFTVGLDNFREQIHAISALLERHKGPIIVAGDLNTWSRSRQTLVDDFMQKHQLEPVSFDPDLRTTAFGKALDHMYVRGITTQSARVVPVSSSDHNPLLVRLQIL
ncbi:MAG: endonuclease/exonuclease/phosphatase family protein [Halioglobus sp.]